MRGIFGIVSLLVTLAIVGLLVKKNLDANRLTPENGTQIAAPEGVTLPKVTPGASPQQQSREIQQQVKQQLDAAAQQTQRAMPDDVK